MKDVKKLINSFAELRNIEENISNIKEVNDSERILKGIISHNMFESCKHILELLSNRNIIFTGKDFVTRIATLEHEEEKPKTKNNKAR